jgi:hypothetical protein
MANREARQLLEELRMQPTTSPAVLAALLGTEYVRSIQAK